MVHMTDVYIIIVHGRGFENVIQHSDSPTESELYAEPKTSFDHYHRHRITLSFPFCILRATRWYFYTTTVGVDSAYIISCSDNTGVGLANAFQYIFINEHQH